MKNIETNKNIVIDRKYTIANKDIQYIEICQENEQDDSFTLKFSNGTNEYVSLSYNKSEKVIYFSRESLETKIINDSTKEINSSAKSYPFSGKRLKLEIFIDTSSIEVFINDEVTLTNTFYLTNPISRVSIECETMIIIDELKVANIELEK